MNKLVKGNLVRGLPSNFFENNHTCVACKKGKQHRASCKTKPISSVNQLLQRSHMDLFGPTFVKSLNKKNYCLVVTDDYSRTSVKPVEHHAPAEHLRKDILKSRVHKHRWNRKAFFVCKSLNHLIKDYDYYEKTMVQKHEADASLAKHKILELEIERLLKAVLSRKLENANVELEFQVLNYAQENAHLKATYKNLFDSISVSCVQTETKIASLQNELQSNIYKNAKLRTQLFKKVSDQKDNTQDSSKNTKFAKQPIAEILPKIGETNALSKPVTSNSVSKPPVSKGMFRISPDKISRKTKKVPNTVSASSKTKPITVSQPLVITKKNVNSDVNGLSSTGVDNTKTRRPQPRSNTKNDRVPSASKSSQNKNKEAEVEEHHRNLLLSKKHKHISSACNNSKIDSQDAISKVVCVVCLYVVDST
nr:putative ribonuclease H-like domain-containing protein [Tanacetum cinerariifolium]